MGDKEDASTASENCKRIGVKTILFLLSILDVDFSSLH